MAVPHRGRGPIIKAVRLALGLPAIEIARSVTTDNGHMDKGYLSSIESGRRNPSVEVTKKIASALDVPEPVLTGQLPAIAVLRTAQGIDAREFATDIGVTPSRLRRLEQGSEIPDPELAAVIARRLGVGPDVIRPADLIAGDR
jgi:transcriptional regulator with XRE-family HTH domain